MGYVLGTPISTLADKTSPKIAFHLTGVWMLFVGWYFGWKFEEGKREFANDDDDDDDDAT